MQFHGRGFYNTLLFSSSETKEKWQIADYRALSNENLFKQLHDLGIPLNEDLFKEYAASSDSPEDLTDILSSSDEGEPEYEKAFLVIFELWRRLLPKKESLSIFCDRLDHLIHDYDEGKPSGEDLVKALSDVLKILEDHVGSGLSQKQAYELFNSYLAQDLESFIYDFLSDLLEAGEKTLAFEFIFGFHDFIHDKLSLDLLKATINLIENPDDSESVFLNVLEKIFEKKRYNLVLDAIYFTHDAGFLSLSKKLATTLLSSTKADEKQEILSLLEPLKKSLSL